MLDEVLDEFLHGSGSGRLLLFGLRDGAVHPPRHRDALDDTRSERFVSEPEITVHAGDEFIDRMTRRALAKLRGRVVFDQFEVIAVERQSPMAPTHSVAPFLE